MKTHEQSSSSGLTACQLFPSDSLCLLNITHNMIFLSTDNNKLVTLPESNSGKAFSVFGEHVGEQVAAETKAAL